MKRLNEKWEALRAQSRKALIPYITAGDPTQDASVPLMHALVATGADILELGIPFSEPMAEGPVIQAAMGRALKQGTYLETVFAMVKKFREQDQATPVILMGYLNPIEIFGYEEFALAVAEAGADGIIIVDLPAEEGEELNQKLVAADIAPIFLIAPTTSAKRITGITSQANGFLYYVSVKGVTGSKNLDVNDVQQHIEVLRQSTEVPIVVGFGISDAQSAAAVSRVADGVVVGSALIRRLANCKNNEQLCQQASEMMSEMRTAMDACVPA